MKDRQKHIIEYPIKGHPKLYVYKYKYITKMDPKQ